MLVVDDDADQLETLCRGLFLLGIDCLPACGLAGALPHLERSPGEPLDLLLTDLTRPAWSGGELIARARAARPGLPVLVITGLALSPEVRALRDRGIPILRKPFTAETLGDAIDALLGPRTPTPGH